tara:strand:- start:259 stop:708 length:450 start_codon:yes stop_codon:yes gene_type:complete
MRNKKLKSVTFSNKKKELEVSYSSGKKAVVHYGILGVNKNIKKVWIDSETKNKSVGIEFEDGSVNYMPYDQPLMIIKDPEFMLQNHIENIIAEIKEKNISKKYIARQLQTSDNQIQRLLNPSILNKNLLQLYKVASLLDLEFEINLKAA